MTLFDTLPQQRRPPRDLPRLNTGSTWKAPSELPSLKGVKRLGFDTETHDPDLDALGPGVRRDGKVVGMSLALDDDGPRIYVPVAHQGGGNLDEAQVKDWARSELANFDGELVGANVLYDLDYMASNEWGVHFTKVKKIHDVLVAEPIIDEWRQRYDLDSVAQIHLGETKAYSHVDRVMANYGWKTYREFKKNLWRLPASDVGEYGEGDADLPLRILPKQLAALEADDQLHIYEDIEQPLIPILLAMRRRGVKVNLTRAHQVHDMLVRERDRWLTKVRYLAGPQAELMSPDSFAAALTERGLTFEMTPKTRKPKIDKFWLESHMTDDLVAAIMAGRRLSTVIGTFLEGHIFGHTIRGRVHCEFNQLKREKDSGGVGGTIARFCLSGGTEITVPGGTRLIEDVKAGDDVYCYDDDQNLSIQKVKWAGKTGMRKVCRVEFLRGNRRRQDEGSTRKLESVTGRKSTVVLYLTPDHQVRLTDGTYKEAGSLKYGDKVMALSRVKSYTKDHRPNYSGLTIFGDRIVSAAGEALTRYSKLWNEGRTISHIARVMSTAKLTVKKRLKELGIDVTVKQTNDHQVIAVENVPGIHEVFDVEVDNYHNFIANEICVHNSSENPNLQNLPARESKADVFMDGVDEAIGDAVRSIFEPEEGELWQRDDFSQIELRFTVNYSVGKGAEEARELYRSDPKTDFHMMYANMIGVDPEDKKRRKGVKNLAFARSYGAGPDKIAMMLGWSVAEAQEFINACDEKVPFMKETYRAADRSAAKFGYVKTCEGRKCRFPFWEPRHNPRPKKPGIKGREAAEAAYGKDIKRSDTYKCLNRKMQGSGAELMKKSMVEAYKAGICDVIGAYLLTVHDELGNSVPMTKEGDQAGKELSHIMETCVKIDIPILVATQRGPNWGAVG